MNQLYDYLATQDKVIKQQCFNPKFNNQEKYLRYYTQRVAFGILPKKCANDLIAAHPIHPLVCFFSNELKINNTTWYCSTKCKDMHSNLY